MPAFSLHTFPLETLKRLAARLAGVHVDQLLKVRVVDDTTLAVIIHPGPKIVYTVRQVAEAIASLDDLVGAPDTAPEGTGEPEIGASGNPGANSQGLVDAPVRPKSRKGK